jgi:hypothetical protein
MLVLAGLLLLHPVTARAAAQRTFDTPESAIQAFIDALRAGDTKALAAILGPGSQRLLSSGDRVRDDRARQQFVKSYDDGHRLEAGGGKIVLVVGKDEYPFPIPVVPAGPVWRFDTDAGDDEILARRIGRNELDVIQVCLAYVDAQREYHERDRTGTGILEYAQRVASTPGKQDGLYWETRPGESPSPLGALVARARSEGAPRGSGTGPIPYHGYYYRILTGQGPNAPGGAYSYLAGRHMIGGFALVAYPAQYGNSGVMTFITSHDGVVYQKDLGPETAARARQMKVFDPDQTWKRVAP